MPLFNEQFDEDLGTLLIRDYQQRVGCFVCGEKSARHNCARCAVAKYCNRNCQKLDWKKRHKSECSLWCDNRAELNNIPGHSVAVCMNSCGYLKEHDLAEAMKARTMLFLQEFADQDVEIPIHLQISVIEIVNKVRLVGSASFLNLDEDDTDKSKVCQVNHVIFQAVDEGEEALSRINRGYGTISESAYEKVKDAVVSFVRQLKQTGNLAIQGCSCGRGLAHVSYDEDFQNAAEEEAGQKISMWL